MSTEKDLWVFLSHSNKDYELVRKVRNMLEEHGKRPLMFFLKCLDDDDEVFELIKREIDARSRFVLCKSRNTEDPNGWVQKEFRYVKEQNKPYEEIDLEDDESLRAGIASLMRRSKVFISYSHKDYDFVKMLEKELEKNAFDIFIDYRDLKSGDNWAYEIRKAVEDAAQNGYVLQICSQSSMNNECWSRKEIEIAINTEGFIIPCIIDRTCLDSRMKISSYRHQWIDASNRTMQEKVQYIVSELKRIDVQKNKENRHE